MKTLISTIKIISCLLLSVKNLYSQEVVKGSDYFMQGDSIQTRMDDQNHLIKLKKDTVCIACIDIVICSHGQANYIYHYEIRDSTVNYYEYRVSADSLLLVSNKKNYINTINLDRFREYNGPYQCLYTGKVNYHSYFKDVSIYHKGVLTSSILFDDVRFSNSALPCRKEIEPIIELIREVDSQ